MCDQAAWKCCSSALTSRAMQATTLQTAAIAGLAEDLKHEVPKEQPISGHLQARPLMPACLPVLPAALCGHRSYRMHSQDPVEEAKLNWTKQWYPMMGIADLDPAVPHPVMLLGKRLVLWRDAQQIWRCLDDSCPHR